MTIHKPFKFIWCHIHLINILDSIELERYAQSVSMSNWNDDITRFLMKAIDIRKEELRTNVNNCMVWQEDLTEIA